MLVCFILFVCILKEQPDKSKDKLDDDQDRKNPAYVPRKGAFYEHDYREGEERAKQQE